jgi:hypothetical protein
MKKLAILLAIMTCSLAVVAQDDEGYNSTSTNHDDIQTIMGKNNAFGGYGSLSIQYTRLDDRDAFVFGARGGVVLGHMVTLGLGGAGFFNDAHYDSNVGANISLAGGYGGFFFEPIIMPKFPVHISFPVLVGAGGVSLVSLNKDSWDNEFNSEASDAFMVIQPGVEVEMNVTKFFRFCVGAYYLYTSDVNIQYPLDYQIPTNILRGISGGVTFKFGRF